MSMYIIKRAGILGALFTHATLSRHISASQQDPHFSRNAACVLEPIGNSKVRGMVSFTQQSATSPVKVASSLRGLIPTQLYTLYIHESGEMTKGEESLGDPYPHDLMLSTDPQSKWDLQILAANYRGTNYATTSSNKLSLYGQHSIAGRSVAVRHLTENPDEEGVPTKQLSLEAVGIIGLTRQFYTLKPM